MYGYSRKILHIDLTTRKTWVETKPEEWYKVYIGGVSMASRLCWENIEVGCNALAPGNPICIANGIFAGTPVPVGGKYGLASKSPLTGFIGDSLSGSWFAIALKRAGWDGVVILSPRTVRGTPALELAVRPGRDPRPELTLPPTIRCRSLQDFVLGLGGALELRIGAAGELCARLEFTAGDLTS